MDLRSLPGVPIIETDRIRIREMRLNDAERYYEMHIEPESLTYYDWMPDSVEDALQGITDIQEDYRELRYIHWGVADKQSDLLIGDMGLFRRDGKGELNFFISRAFQRQGLMGEALSAIVSWCFNETEIYRLQALTIPENVGAKGLLCSLGFSAEGVLRQYGYNAILGRYTDLTMWALLKADAVTPPCRITGYHRAI